MSRIGKFEVLRELGKGACGSVYKAVDPATQKVVAVRRVNWEAFSANAHALREETLENLRRATALDSPNIARTLAIEEEGSCLLVVTEHVEGITLRSLLENDTSFSAWDLIDMTRQVCSAIDHAHSRGLCHENLHPGNIVQEWDSNMKLLDYGLPLCLPDRAEPGTVPESCHYLSPEQAQRKQPERRSNLFSWGAILYEMASGRLLFNGTDIKAVLNSIAAGSPEMPEMRVCFSFPPDKVILKALSKAANDRYQSGDDLVRALEGCNQSNGGVPTVVAQPAKSASNHLPTPARKTMAQPAAQVAEAAAGPVSRTAASPATSYAAQKVKPLPNMAGSTITASMLFPVATSTSTPKPATPIPASTDAKPTSPIVSSTPQKTVAVASRPAPAQQQPVAAPAPALVLPVSKTTSPAPAAAQTSRSAASATVASPAPQAAQGVIPKPEGTLASDEQIEPVSDEAKPSTKQASKARAKLKRSTLVFGAAALLFLVIGVLAGYGVHSHRRKEAEKQQQAAALAAAMQAASPAVVADTPVEPVIELPSELAPKAPSTSAVTVRKKGNAQPIPTSVPVPVMTADLLLESSPAGAQVQVDGNNTGLLTPCTLAGLSAGEHTITLTRTDYATERRTIQLRAGQRASLAVALNEHRATASISSEPAGASVVLDGKDTGRITPLALSVPRGRHTIAIIKNGYFEASKSFDFVPGQTYEFPFHLTAMGRSEEIKEVGKFKKFFGGSAQNMGRVEIRSFPKSAQIAVNGRVMDNVTPAEYFFPAGTYQIMVTYTGYKPFHKTVTIGSGTKVVVSALMEKTQP